MYSFDGLLTATLFVPLAGAIVIVALLKQDRLIRYWAAAIGVIDLALAIMVFVRFDPDGAAQFQLIDKFIWIKSTVFTSNYHLGVDGLSLSLIHI